MIEANFVTLYGTDASGGNLLRLNIETGEGTVVGSFAAGVMPSLAIDPTTGFVMYAGTGGGIPNLYTVDAVTGAATLVGSSGLGFAAIGGMDFRKDGTLFAAVNIAGDGGTGSDHLAIIDKTTGAATVIGPFGTCTGVVIPSSGGGSCSIEGIEGIAFDNRGTTLYGVHSARGRAGSPGTYRIDPMTGQATYLAPFLEAGTGATLSGGVVSLARAPNGWYFGGTARAIPPATVGGRLIKISPKNGRFSFVGSQSATGGSSLGGLAFSPPARRAGGYVTGNRVVTLSCFDFRRRLLGSAATPAANYVGAGTGIDPNFYLEVEDRNYRIARCTFEDGGNTYTVDDFTFNLRVKTPD